MNPPSLFDDEDWRDALKKLSERIAGNEADSILARWEFGRLLLERRKGKQLPRGVLAEVVKTHGISQREVGYRMQFAEKFSTEEEVGNALQTHKSWRRIVSKALPEEPRKKPDVVRRFNSHLMPMIFHAQELEKVCRDKQFARYVDQLREEWRDEERDPRTKYASVGISFAHYVITKSVDKARDELAGEQGSLFEDSADGASTASEL